MLSLFVMLFGAFWFGVSVVVLYVFWIVPSMKPKPPPVSRRPSETVSSLPSPPSSILNQDGGTPCKCGNRVSFSDETPRSPTKKRWSSPARLFASAKSSPSPRSDPRSDFIDSGLFAILTSPSIRSRFSLSREGSLVSSLSESRPTFHSRLPSLKLFKSKSRKSSGVPESIRSGSDPVSLSSTSTTASAPPPIPYHKLRNYETPTGEMLRTTFVNPFRFKPRRAKTFTAASDASLSNVARASAAAERPNYRHFHSFHPKASTDARVSSRRPREGSVSSASTAASYASSISPRDVPRTQPYSAPYHARMPGDLSSTRSQAPRRGGLSGPERSALRPSERVRSRAQSLRASEELPPNALGLSLHQESTGCSGKHGTGQAPARVW
ncbi:hypothetical protein A0H81_01366 [Grifola frondosa]|uniref:Uncharacterized protein n=1 Tax=Grifola frondosa TaxID=5627 RepID=A0A1C7MSG1_GRIFR|nr:hypothetical protein A0H81_01366 [Grifola frondosa]